jgi:hypothetical protein
MGLFTGLTGFAGFTRFAGFTGLSIMRRFAVETRHATSLQCNSADHHAAGFNKLKTKNTDMNHENPLIGLHGSDNKKIRN